MTLQEVANEFAKHLHARLAALGMAGCTIVDVPADAMTFPVYSALPVDPSGVDLDFGVENMANRVMRCPAKLSTFRAPLPDGAAGGEWEGVYVVAMCDKTYIGEPEIIVSFAYTTENA